MRRLTKWSASLLVAVPLSAAAPSPTADLDVLHYALTVTPDFDRHSISGESQISFRSQRDALAEVRFSANSLTVDRATMRGEPVGVSRASEEIGHHVRHPHWVAVAVLAAPADSETFTEEIGRAHV